MQSNTAAVRNQAINFTNISVENRKPDPFTIVDGRYVGHDGFVVPKNFDEFHERFPHYVRNWVSRHVDRSAPREDVEDWTQDLLIHLRYLPAISKHREAGKEDIVQTFDPHKHHGANQCPVSELHQPVPREQIQDDSLSPHEESRSAAPATCP